MNKLTKALVGVLCLAAVTAGTIYGTVAYITDRDSIANTFTVGNIDISLDEAVVDEDGNAVTPASRTEEGNAYHLIPGMKYGKDPTVTVEPNSEEAYVRMIMTVRNASAVQAIIDKSATDSVVDYADLFEGWQEDKWIYEDFTSDTVNNTISFEFRYYKTVETGSSELVLEPLFTKLVVPGFVTSDDLKALYGSDGAFKMNIVAHAIQAASFEAAGNKTAEDVAWEAFEFQFNG